jgi:hypothetical protein
MQYFLEKIRELLPPSLPFSPSLPLPLTPSVVASLPSLLPLFGCLFVWTELIALDSHDFGLENMQQAASYLPVLRIRDPVPFGPWFWDPGWVKKKQTPTAGTLSSLPSCGTRCDRAVFLPPVRGPRRCHAILIVLELCSPFSSP